MINSDTGSDIKKRKNKFLRFVSVLFAAALTAAAGAAGILTADTNIRGMAFSSAKPLASAEIKDEELSLNILGQKIDFSENDIDNFLKNAEKWRALVPSEFRIYAETAVWICAEISSLI